jgi:hypothetical protein
LVLISLMRRAGLRASWPGLLLAHTTIHIRLISAADGLGQPRLQRGRAQPIQQVVDHRTGHPWPQIPAGAAPTASASLAAPAPRPATRQNPTEDPTTLN